MHTLDNDLWINFLNSYLSHSSPSCSSWKKLWTLMIHMERGHVPFKPASQMQPLHIPFKGHAASGTLAWLNH